MNEQDGTMQFDDETLMAYADGELDESTRSTVEAAVARDGQLAAKVEEYRQLRAQVVNAFADELHDPIPDRLLATARSAPAGNVTSLAQARTEKAKRRWSWPEWSAIAASLIVGVLIARFGTNPEGSFETDDGRLFASGDLAKALDQQRGGERSAQSRVEIGLSYRIKSGDFCRTFNADDSASVSGIACRSDRGWEIQALVRGKADTGRNFRMATTSVPPLILQIVESSMDGDALDEQAESEAINRKWKASTQH